MTSESWWEGFFEGSWAAIQRAWKGPAETQADIETILRMLAPPPGAAILDAPCGEGRIAIELARAGYRATGVDLQPALVERARAAADEAGADARFETGDIRRLRWEDEFDAALCWWGSFGYFTDEENLAAAASACRALRPGGAYLIDTGVMETVLPVYRDRDWQELNGVRILEARTWHPETSRIEVLWTFLVGEKTVLRRSDIRIYSCRELRELLLEAGFTSVDVRNAGGEGPLEVGARRALFLARK